MRNVWVNGCFDILHRGHVELLTYAKSSGDFLIVGIDTDRRVKEAKGDSRPYNCMEDRKYFLESLQVVDKVISFDTDEELKEHLKLHDIDIMIVGSDWKGKPVVGAEIAKKLLYFDRIGNYSTTNILEATK